jgi:hypothetical protein
MLVQGSKFWTATFRQPSVHIQQLSGGGGRNNLEERRSTEDKSGDSDKHRFWKHNQFQCRVQIRKLSA